MMKTLTIRLSNDDYQALKTYAASRRTSMTSVIMHQLDTLGITKPPQRVPKTDVPDDLVFTDE
jgi:hypothetical protein